MIEVKTPKFSFFPEFGKVGFGHLLIVFGIFRDVQVIGIETLRFAFFPEFLSASAPFPSAGSRTSLPLKPVPGTRAAAYNLKE